MPAGPLPNIFGPVSTPAYAIREPSWLLLAITAAIFRLVDGVVGARLIGAEGDVTLAMRVRSIAG